MSYRRFARFFILIVLMASAGCSSRYSAPDGWSSEDVRQDSRYSIKQDRAPDTVLDGHRVKEVIPRNEPRSAGGNKSPYTVRGQTYYVKNQAAGWTQTGVASWYGAKFHGHKTSNGEIFDMYQISAAHKTLPIPTYVRVTNLDNGKSIIARINDRGPFHGGRVIDLSYAGAVKLGYQSLGTARVKVEVVTPSSERSDSPVVTGSQEYYLQVGAFSDVEKAHALAEEVRKYTRETVFVHITDMNRVKIGPMSFKSATRLQKKLTRRDYGPPIVIQ